MITLDEEEVQHSYTAGNLIIQDNDAILVLEVRGNVGAALVIREGELMNPSPSVVHLNRLQGAQVFENLHSAIEAFSRHIALLPLSQTIAHLLSY